MDNNEELIKAKTNFYKTANVLMWAAYIIVVGKIVSDAIKK